MAQTLKKDKRLDIIEAAKKELLTYGYKEASMRRIALCAHMTVGNLYRYFENKDDLIQTIVEPTLKKLEKALAFITNSDFSFDSLLINFNSDIKEMHSLFDQIADILVDLYISDNQEMSILMMHSKLHEMLADYFSLLLLRYGFNTHGNLLSDQQKATLAKSIAYSIFSGVHECLKDNTLGVAELKELLRLYFRLYSGVIDLKKFGI